jgi:hypothetical protein
VEMGAECDTVNDKRRRKAYIEQQSQHTQYIIRVHSVGARYSEGGHEYGDGDMRMVSTDTSISS